MKISTTNNFFGVVKSTGPIQHIYVNIDNVCLIHKHSRPLVSYLYKDYVYQCSLNIYVNPLHYMIYRAKNKENASFGTLLSYNLKTHLTN